MTAIKRNQLDKGIKEQAKQWVQPGAMDEVFDFSKMQMSYYEKGGCVASSNRSITFDVFFDYIKNATTKTTYKKITLGKEYYHKLWAAYDEDRNQYNKLKAILTVVTLSTIAKSRKSREAGAFNGCFQIDIDAKDAQNKYLLNRNTFNETKNKLANDPYSLFVCNSPSNRGLKVGFRVDPYYYAETMILSSINKEARTIYNQAYFDKISEYFRIEYNLYIDPAISSENEMFYVPYDTDLRTNPHAKIFEAPERPNCTVKYSGESMPTNDQTKPYDSETTKAVGATNNESLFASYNTHFNSIEGWNSEIMSNIAHSPTPNNQGRGWDYMRIGKKNGSIAYTLFTNENPFKLYVHSSSTVFEAGHTYNLADAIKFGKFGGSQEEVTQYIKATMKAINPEYGKKVTTKSEPTAFVKPKFQSAETIPYVFWYVEEIGKADSSKKKLAINENKVYDYLKSLGYCQIQWEAWGKKQIKLVRIIENVVEVVEIKELRTALGHYINLLPFQITEEFTREDLFNTIAKLMRQLIIEEKIDIFMPKQDVCFVNSINKKNPEKSVCYYFRNCWVEVTQDNIKKQHYKTLKGLVWKHSLIDGEFHQLSDVAEICNSPRSYLYKFSTYQCTDPKTMESDLDLYERVTWGIAYLMDQKRDITVNLIPFFTEANLDINSRNGGTGKGIIVQILETYRNVTKVAWSQNDQFNLSEVTPWTDIIAIQEIAQEFDFDKELFSVADGIKIELKGINKETIPPDETPKIICNSNFPVNTAGGCSSRRRLLEIELKPFFNDVRTPASVLDTKLLDKHGRWNQEDWDLAHSTIFLWTQNYLNNPKPPVHNGNITQQRRIAYNTIDGFDDWASDYFINENGSLKDKGFQIGSLINDYAEHCDLDTKPKQSKFTHSLNLWLTAKQLTKYTALYQANDYSKERKKGYKLKKLIE